MPPPQQLTQLSSDGQHLLYPEAGAAKPQVLPVEQRSPSCIQSSPSREGRDRQPY